MGQIFHATAYDIDTKTRFTLNVDKFHANCYSYSRAICAIHYLLRQKPYRVMWGGGYVVIDDNLRYFAREEDLMGISTYEDLESFELNNDDLSQKVYFDKVKRIEEYSKDWTRLSNVLDKSLKYFNHKSTKSVLYSGYLVNHTKKLAVNLKSYWKKSFSYYGWRNVGCIDPVPALTETGEGLAMALFEGLTLETTESLGGTWCGDLLQIVDELPKKYVLITCCFANFVRRGSYCYDKYGADKQNYLLGEKGNRFEGCELNMLGKRGDRIYLKVVKKNGGQLWFDPKRVHYFRP